MSFMPSMFTLSKTLTAILIATSLISAPLFAQANTTKAVEKKVSKKTKKKTPKLKITETRLTDAEEAAINLAIEEDIKLSTSLEYKCELGNSVVLYSQETNDQVVNMRWKNRLYKLSRVETSTGANRYENEKAGLVWINIPSKGLLLDSLHGRQLANDCKSALNNVIS